MRNIKRLAIVCSLLLLSVSTASAEKELKFSVLPETVRFKCVQGFVFAISYSGSIAQVFAPGLSFKHPPQPITCEEKEEDK